MWFVLWWPFRVVLATIRGFGGRTDHALGLSDRLSPNGLATLKAAPERITAGLERPLGDYGDLALHYVVEQYKAASNRKWANRQIGRVRDVAAVVSAAVISLAMWVGASAVQTVTVDSTDLTRLEATRQDARRLRASLQSKAPLSKLTQLLTQITPRGSASRETEVLREDSARALGRSRLLDSLVPVDPQEIQQLIDEVERLIPNFEAQEKPGIEEQIKRAREFHAEWSAAEANYSALQRRQLLGRIMAVAAIQLTLFLYLILFVTLRAAVETMIEALAIERAELAAADGPQELAGPATATVLRVASTNTTTDRSAS
jgi:hypothetical protein